MTDRQKNIVRAKAIEEKNKQRILAVNPKVDDNSGIYILTREENGFKYAYVGQAKHLLTRLAQHLNGYQHIDLSLKKHELYSKDNPTGWNIMFTKFNANELDEQEKRFIRCCADDGYQLYNHTTGSQGEGKRALGETKSPKGYRDGVVQGERNAIKKIAHLFDSHLKAVTKAEKPSKNAEKALLRFYEIIQGDNEQ